MHIRMDGCMFISLLCLLIVFTHGAHVMHLHSFSGLQRQRQVSDEAQMHLNAKQYAERLQSNARVRKLIGHVAGQEHKFVQV